MNPKPLLTAALLLGSSPLALADEAILRLSAERYSQPHQLQSTRDVLDEARAARRATERRLNSADPQGYANPNLRRQERAIERQRLRLESPPDLRAQELELQQQQRLRTRTVQPSQAPGLRNRPLPDRQRLQALELPQQGLRPREVQPPQTPGLRNRLLLD